MNAIHGRPLLSPPQGATIHTTTHADNIVYLFAYSISEEEDVLCVYTQSGGNKTLITSHLLSAQSHPYLVLNGYILSKRSSLIVESGNNVVCTGWISEDETTRKVAEDIYCNKLNYKIQTVIPSRDEVMIDPNVPVTIIHPSISETSLVLPDGESGVCKTILLKCNLPVTCRVKVKSFSFPTGRIESTGVLSFKNNGDSAQLIWTGSEWMITNSGCEVI